MTPHFVPTSQVQPPPNQTLLCRAGGSVFFAAWFIGLGWQHVYGGKMEAIAQPEFWWRAE